MGRRLVLGLWLGSLVLVGLALIPARARSANRSVLRLGLVSSLFREMPKTMIEVVSEPLKTLLEAQTGLTGHLESNVDAWTLGKQLQDGQVDLAILHGFEFAWVRQKYTEVQPLLLVSCPQRFQAFLVVPDSSPAAGCDDLKGKVLAFPRRSREHLHLFLERRCLGGCKEPKDFFARVVRTADADDALDDLLEGSFDAALVDYGSLAAYRSAKPDHYAHLRVLLKSETFPAGVIAYKSGVLSEDLIQRIRGSLLAASQSSQGLELLKLCRMTGFEQPPADFDQVLQAIARAYPPPPTK